MLWKFIFLFPVYFYLIRQSFSRFCLFDCTFIIHEFAYLSSYLRLIPDLPLYISACHALLMLAGTYLFNLDAQSFALVTSTKVRSYRVQGRWSTSHYKN